MIMQSQILNVQRVEIVFRKAAKHFPETWHHTAGKDIFFNPRIPGVFFECADEV